MNTFLRRAQCERAGAGELLPLPEKADMNGRLLLAIAHSYSLPLHNCPSEFLPTGAYRACLRPKAARPG